MKNRFIFTIDLIKKLIYLLRFKRNYRNTIINIEVNYNLFLKL